MMSETEKKRMRDIEQATHELLKEFNVKVQVDGEESELGAAQIFGILMAVFDAMFAIRDGGEWRGMTDPKKIATQILHDLELGDR